MADLVTLEIDAARIEERLKFTLWLQDHYVVRSGNLYRITHDDLLELNQGLPRGSEMWKFIATRERVSTSL